MNWDSVPEPEEAAPLIPAGSYPCKVERVKVDNPGRDNECWTVYSRVCEGPQEGALIVDRLFWTERATPRIKGIFTVLGLPNKGVSAPQPEWMRGRFALIEVVQEEYKGRMQNKVPYLGWHRPQDESVNPPFVVPQPQALPLREPGSDDVPF